MLWVTVKLRDGIVSLGMNEWMKVHNEEYRVAYAVTIDGLMK